MTPCPLQLPPYLFWLSQPFILPHLPLPHLLSVICLCSITPRNLPAHASLADSLSFSPVEALQALSCMTEHLRIWGLASGNSCSCHGFSPPSTVPVPLKWGSKGHSKPSILVPYVQMKPIRFQSCFRWCQRKACIGKT